MFTVNKSHFITISQSIFLVKYLAAIMRAAEIYFRSTACWEVLITLSDKDSQPLRAAEQNQGHCQVPHFFLDTHWKVQVNAPPVLLIRKGPGQAPTACTLVILPQRLCHNLPMHKTHLLRWGAGKSPWEAAWPAFSCAGRIDDQERLAHHWHRLGKGSSSFCVPL